VIVVETTLNFRNGSKEWLIRFSWDPLSTRASRDERLLLNSMNCKGHVTGEIAELEK
jgi:hypothetical protein